MNHERLLKIILLPHTSEKSSGLAEKYRTYVFKVVNDSTKPEIKQAVEFLFKTQVDAVRIVNVKGKPKRFKNIQGRTRAWKKAYVTLSPGNEINLSAATPR